MISVKEGAKYLALIRLACIVLVGVLYIILFSSVSFGKDEAPKEEAVEESLFRLVDVQEYVPPSKPVNIPAPKVPEEVKVVENNAAASEKIIETKEEIKEVEKPSASEDDEYIPQQKVSVIPVVPAKRLLKRIEYPSDAYKKGIEGIVYLELFIDAEGNIKKIKVLKDPGNGFAEAALKAFEGIICQPAVVDGRNVPVRFRYPVRFSIR